MAVTTTAVRERPILFSAPMVRAILDGKKTQTRRVVKGPVDFIGAGGRGGPDWDDPTCWGWADEYGDYHTLAPEGQSSCDSSCVIPCPYGRVGDRLWVRETWQSVPFGPHRDWPGCPDLRPRKVCEFNRACVVIYRADGEMPGDEIWRPSIHMPRWASRITLEITGVRAERLHEISEEDAKAEGAVEAIMGLDGPAYDRAEKAWCRATKTDDPDAGAATARGAFFVLWNTINGKTNPWSRNPWTWVVSFRCVDAKGVA